MPDILKLRDAVTSYAKTFQWEITIPNPPVPIDPNLIRILANTTSIPGKSIETIEVNRKGMKFHIGGRITFPDSIALGFKDTEDYKIHKFLKSWLDLVHSDQTGLQASPSTYKTRVYLNLLTENNTSGYRIYLDGAFPKELSDISLSYDNSSLVELESTFSFDFWRQESA